MNTVQNSIDTIRRHAKNINAEGYDVEGTFTNMRDVERANLCKQHSLKDIIVEGLPDAEIEDINGTLYVSPKQSIYRSEI